MGRRHRRAQVLTHETLRRMIIGVYILTEHVVAAIRFRAVDDVGVILPDVQGQHVLHR